MQKKRAKLSKKLMYHESLSKHETETSPQFHILTANDLHQSFVLLLMIFISHLYKGTFYSVYTR